MIETTEMEAGNDRGSTWAQGSMRKGKGDAFIGKKCKELKTECSKQTRKEKPG